MSLSTLLPAIAALLAVLALITLAGRAARLARFARLPAGRRMTVQDSLALDRARRLVLIRCDGRDLLILTGGAADQVVGWLPEAAP